MQTAEAAIAEGTDVASTVVESPKDEQDKIQACQCQTNGVQKENLWPLGSSFAIIWVI